MVAVRMREIVVGLVVVGGVMAGLAGCAPVDSSTGDTGSDSGDTTTEESADDGASADFVTVSGTGTYAIGVDIPLGGFQLQGEPDAQPEGCTWAILDADGGVTFENQGQYVFLTDIPEAVTFETAGCPDWEQFE